MKNNKFWKSFAFVALDIETTGLDPQNCEIIEIGAVRFKEGKEAEEFSVLIKPTQEVPTFIKQLTGIKESDLENGVNIKKALTELLEFIQKDPIICHNSGFDLTFIQNNLTMHLMPSLTNSSFDTLEVSRIYLPFIRNHKLETVADALQIKPPNKYHRALNDALITGNVFIRLTEFIIENMPFEVNTALLELAEYAEQDADLERFFKKIVEHQRQFALIDRKSDDYYRLYQSPYAKTLGFTQSHNLIRTENWYQEKEAEKLSGNQLSTMDFTSSDSTEPNPIEDYKKMKSEESIVNLSFQPDGFFAHKFPEYEYREGQVEMAHAIDNALNNDEFLIIEAGTGIGKTLAYLVTALHFAIKKSRKVNISTNTKNLQEQLFYKDLPIIKQCVPVPFQAVILKGRENYLCYRKWKETHTGYRKLVTPYEAGALLNLVVWQKYTRSGDISENSSFVRESETDIRRQYSSIWRKISSERYFCSGRKCADYNQCYYMGIRQKAEKSSLVVTNHSLLLTDLSFDRFNNDEENYLIIDEAHNLPEMASSYLGISISYTDITNYIHQLANINVRRNLQAGILPNLKGAIQKSVIDDKKKTIFHSDIDRLILSLEDPKQFGADYFRTIGERVGKQGSFGKQRVKQQEDNLLSGIEQLIEYLTIIQKGLFNLSQFLSQINQSQIADHDEHQEKLSGALEKVKDIIEALKILKEPDFDNFALWLSSFTTSEPNFPSGVINYAPLDVSSYLQKILYNRMNSLIFTSATLALRNNFKFFTMRMGLPFDEEKVIRESIIPSPFDYNKQTLVLAASYLPIPSDEYFTPQSIELLKMAIDSAKVGSMVLFTSYKDLNTVYEQISEDLYKKDILLLAQGRGYSRTVTLNEFRDHGRAVLLGTSSFWEGVDVPGESLSLLILYKLPFQVPSEPIIEAYYEKLRKEGKDPFMYSTLPNAMLRFRQGFGRLIRNKRDRGVVLIADSRVINKFYGGYFREIIPTKIYSAETPIEICDLVSSWFSK
ncbi:MAG: 3'-5' exoribonuclease [Candidatus Cloacimonetes bacterium]|nr:3'-5' exoribonuclease [Candidatus Cloacimonadota bacterium]